MELPANGRDLAEVRRFLATNRYWQAIAQLGEGEDSASAELRQEAQIGIEKVVNEIIKRGSQLRWGQRAFDEQQIQALRADLILRTSAAEALNDSREAYGYTTELQAREVEELGDRNRRRGIIYAARALATDEQLAEVAQRIADLELPGSRVVETPKDSEERGATAKLAEQDAPEELGHDDLGLSALERSEVAIEQNQLDEGERALAEARTLLGDDAVYQGRIQRLAQQIDALRITIPALRQELDQPLIVWMRDGEQREQGCSEGLTALSQIFALDNPLIAELRALLKARVEAWRSTEEKVASLQDLEGEALATIVNELAPLVPADLPALVEARERLESYVAAEVARKSQEQLEAAIAQAIKYNRELKARADNLYEEINVASDHITTLRGELEDAYRSPMLPPEENPIDAASFAYYDLIFANLFRDINFLSEEAQAAATLQNLGELADAYKAQQKYVNKLEREADPSGQAELARANEKLREIEQQLRERLTSEANETLAGVGALLTTFDYGTAREHLNSIRRRISEAELSLDAEIERKLAEQERSVNELADRNDRAEAQLQLAGELTERRPPDFERALKALDQAASEAVWRREELEERRVKLRERRVRYSSELIQQLGAYVRSGDDASLERAAPLLSELDLLPLSDEQRDRVTILRDSINQQHINREQISQIRGSVGEVLEQTKAGKELDEVAAKIHGLRARLGSKDSPNLPGEVWNELSALLDTAEQRISRWRQYRERLLAGQQAAVDGRPDGVRTAFRTIEEELGSEIYLPITADRSELLGLASNSSATERIREQLNRVLVRLIDSDSSVTAGEIESVIKSASLVDDPWIKQTRTSLMNEYLPLYRARESLARSISKGEFIAFEQAYNRLSSELRETSLIAQLYQQAEAARIRIALEQELEDLLREVKPHFNAGWESPTNFLAAVSEIRKFADGISPTRRQETLRLAAATLSQLAALGDLLLAAQSDYEARRFSSAQNRVNLARTLIPANAITTTNMLNPYADDLGYLRGVLNGKYDELTIDVENQKKDTEQIEGALRNYLEVVGNKPSAFITGDLFAIQRQFAPIKDPRSQEHIDVIKAITALLERLDGCTDLFLTDPSDASEPSQRRLRLEQELAAIRNESDRIRQDPIGQHWLGLADNERYKLLTAHVRLAEILAKADAWLIRARNAASGTGTRNIGALDALIAEGNTLALEVDGSYPALADPNSGLVVIPTTLSQRSASVNTGINALKGRRRTLARGNSRRLVLYTALGTLAAIIAMGAAIPRVREPMREVFYNNVIGTYTPTVPPTIEPTIAAQATIDAQATILAQTPTPTLTPTLTPTPTPIMPQSAEVIFPGQISVRTRPNLELGRIDFLVRRDKVSITAFSVDPTGRRWYRIDAPAKELQNVWMLAEADIGSGQRFETLRILEGNGQLRGELEIPYQP
jgi:cell division protein ZapA (FtsZ GTPase activity inhibitor)